MINVHGSKVFRFDEVNEENNKVLLIHGCYHFEIWVSEGRGTNEYSGK